MFRRILCKICRGSYDKMLYIFNQNIFTLHLLKKNTNIWIKLKKKKIIHCFIWIVRKLIVFKTCQENIYILLQCVWYIKQYKWDFLNSIIKEKIDRISLFDTLKTPTKIYNY